jgi:hypothetical protein
MVVGFALVRFPTDRLGALRGQAALLPAGAKGLATVAPVVGMQELWQFIACVSQLI